MLQVGAQDLQEKFWDVIEKLDVNMVLRWFKNNIVFAIIILTRYYYKVDNCSDK
jgi:hypothetical protein